MDPFHDGQSEIGRSSRRGSLGFPMADSDNDSDFDLAEATVCDGFRPSQASQSPQSPQSPPQPPGSISEGSSSVIKQQGLPDSSALHHDDVSDVSRPLTDAPQLRPQSPYRGPSAPSHPYQSYLQRTLSNATSSTAPGPTEHSYHGPRGPAHPYGQYTQSVAPNGDDITQRRDTYQRQLGPDGEEGGLVGPLGHREELPPYSRYPSQPLALKAPVEAADEGLETTTTTTRDAAATATRQLAIPGAGGIGVATLNPEFSATEEDMALSRSHPSIESRHEINTAARDIAEKPHLNKWQRRAKKKLWGIVPYWAICLVLIVVLLMVIILAAVIGTVLSHRNQDSQPHNDPGSSPTGMPDVAPLPTAPASLQHLDTGCYSLPPFLAAQNPHACIADSAQSSAWDCDVSSWAYLINITHHPERSKTKSYDLTLTATGLANAFMWGMQPFQLKYPTQLTLVDDVFDKRYGPAWWSSFSYDKTVILAADSLNANGDTHNKRWHHIQDRVGDGSVAPEISKNSAVAQDGDICWLCSWPETTVEIFIYPNQIITPSLPTTSPPSRNTAHPSDPSSAVPTGLPSKVPLPIPIPSSYNMTLPRPMYPKAVKFVERRHPGPSNKAYCRKVEIFDNGHKFRNLTHNGQPIVLDITENASSLKPQQAKLSWHQERDSYELTQCACLWWL